MLKVITETLELAWGVVPSSTWVVEETWWIGGVSSNDEKSEPSNVDNETHSSKYAKASSVKRFDILLLSMLACFEIEQTINSSVSEWQAVIPSCKICITKTRMLTSYIYIRGNQSFFNKWWLKSKTYQEKSRQIMPKRYTKLNVKWTNKL